MREVKIEVAYWVGQNYNTDDVVDEDWVCWAEVNARQVTSVIELWRRRSNTMVLVRDAAIGDDDKLAQVGSMVANVLPVMIANGADVL